MINIKYVNGGACGEILSSFISILLRSGQHISHFLLKQTSFSVRRKKRVSQNQPTNGGEQTKPKSDRNFASNILMGFLEKSYSPQHQWLTTPGDWCVTVLLCCRAHLALHGSVIWWFALQETSLLEKLQQKLPPQKCKINTTNVCMKDQSHRRHLLKEPSMSQQYWLCSCPPLVILGVFPVGSDQRILQTSAIKIVTTNCCFFFKTSKTNWKNFSYISAPYSQQMKRTLQGEGVFD